MSYVLDAIKKNQGDAPSKHQSMQVPHLKETGRRGWWVALFVLVLTGFTCWLFFDPHKHVSSLVSNAAEDRQHLEAKHPLSNKVELDKPTSLTHVSAKLRQEDALAFGQVTKRSSESLGGQNQDHQGIDYQGKSPRKVTNQIRVEELPLAEPHAVDKKEAVEVPLLSSMPSAFRNRLPQIRFNAHFYSTNKDNGTVMINNRLYRAGDAFAEGIKIEEITPTGVIMAYHEDRFRVEILGNYMY